jgi:threonine synthase
MKNVIGARCIRCGREVPARPELTVCECGGVMDIRYDYAYIRNAVDKAWFAASHDNSMWRNRAFLPVEEETKPPPLRVGGTPLYDVPRLACDLGIARLWIKDDGLNPTGSLKDRPSAMAVAKAMEAGFRTVACSSTGNAASSLAGNAAAAGLRSFIFVPSRAPVGKVAQLKIFGATVISVEGSYEETFRLSAEAIEKYGWYNRNAAINPYLMEGKKTVALEIAEQLGWRVPDYIAVSVGAGCTIAGVWKGFQDLYATGFIDRLPKLISVQAAGCYPINRAVETGEEIQPMAENTIADSIAVGVPRNPDKAMRAIQESRGLTVEVTDEEIFAAMRLLGKTCGVFGEPAGVAATAGLKKAAAGSMIPDNATVVSIVTGNGLKDTASGIRAAGEPIRLPPVMALLEEALQKAGAL